MSEVDMSYFIHNIAVCISFDITIHRYINPGKESQPRKLLVAVLFCQYHLEEKPENKYGEIVVVIKVLQTDIGFAIDVKPMGDHIVHRSLGIISVEVKFD